MIKYGLFVFCGLLSCLKGMHQETNRDYSIKVFTSDEKEIILPEYFIKKSVTLHNLVKDLPQTNAEISLPIQKVLLQNVLVAVTKPSIIGGKNEKELIEMANVTEYLDMLEVRLKILQVLKNYYLKELDNFLKKKMPFYFNDLGEVSQKELAELILTDFFIQFPQIAQELRLDTIKNIPQAFLLHRSAQAKKEGKPLLLNVLSKLYEIFNTFPKTFQDALEAYSLVKISSSLTEGVTVEPHYPADESPLFALPTLSALNQLLYAKLHKWKETLTAYWVGFKEKMYRFWSPKKDEKK